MDGDYRLNDEKDRLIQARIDALGAALFGGEAGWTPQVRQCCYPRRDYHRADGLHVSLSGSRDRIEAVAHYYYEVVRLDAAGPAERRTIVCCRAVTVSASRDTAAAAADLRKRWWPDVACGAADASEHARKDQQYAQNTLAAASAVRGAGAEGTGAELRLKVAGEGYGYARVNGPDSVSLDLRSLPVALAVQVLQLVKP